MWDVADLEMLLTGDPFCDLTPRPPAQASTEMLPGQGTKPFAWARSARWLQTSRAMQLYHNVIVMSPATCFRQGEGVSLGVAWSGRSACLLRPVPAWAPPSPMGPETPAHAWTAARRHPRQGAGDRLPRDFGLSCPVRFGRVRRAFHSGTDELKP